MAINGISGANGLTALPEAMLEVFSLDILHNAQGIMRFEEFAVRKQELLAAPGEVVKFTIYDDIARNDPVLRHRFVCGLHQTAAAAIGPGIPGQSDRAGGCARSLCP